MRTLHVLAYDDFIEGTTPVYTSPDYNTQLSLAEKLKLIAVVDSVTAGTSVTVQLEESGDERNWASKAATAEINGSAISSTAVTVAAGYDNGSTPSSGFVRARISIGGTSPKANVKLWITCRSEEVGPEGASGGGGGAGTMAFPTGNA